ncbi:DUF4255 domain-containing protein [Kitasatospora sp. NPDC087314]|uniref:DUF4255 domain-containing protein n=1 Tax=Kitasatospora sp. NPDC087314 TaxID=3364068 RepID=UPI0037F9F1A5
MSNSLAIAAVTSTLRYVLDTAIGGTHPGSVGGAQVTTLRPDRIIGDDLAHASGVNLFLYLVTPNATWRGRDLPSRGDDGTVLRSPVTALDLHYLITCYGQDSALEGQRLLGRALDALAVTPVLGPDVVAAAVQEYGAADETAFLKDADLADQIESVRMSPATMSVDDLSKVWSVFPQSPYLLSVGYTAGVVLLTGDATARRALPVSRRAISVAPAGAPRLFSLDTAPPGAVVRAGSVLSLRGERLLGATTQVRIGPVRLPVRPDATPTTVTVSLDAGVPAGLHPVQVLQLEPAGAPGPSSPRIVATSNRLPVTVRPTVVRVTVGTADLLVVLDPPLFAGQGATVSLTRLDSAATTATTATSVTSVTSAPDELSFAVPPVRRGAPPLTSVDLPRRAIPDGRWLVRVRVDGVESVPELVDGVYQAPAVTLPVP